MRTFPVNHAHRNASRNQSDTEYQKCQLYISREEEGSADCRNRADEKPVGNLSCFFVIHFPVHCSSVSAFVFVSVTAAFSFLISFSLISLGRRILFHRARFRFIVRHRSPDKEPDSDNHDKERNKLRGREHTNRASVVVS